MEKKKNKIIFIILLVLSIVGYVGYIGYLDYKTKRIEEENKKLVEEMVNKLEQATKEIAKKDSLFTDSTKNTIIITKDFYEEYE